MNDLQILQLFFFVLCHCNYLRKTDNSIQRSTNLMTHICQKDRLHLVSFFRPPLSFDQLLRTTNPVTDIVYQSKYLIPFERSDTCLKIMLDSIYFKWIFYFFQFSILQAFSNIIQKQVTDFGGINISPIRTTQHFHRMKQNSARCHQHIGNKEIIIKNKNEFRQRLYYLTIVLFQMVDMLFFLTLRSDVYRICQ